LRCAFSPPHRAFAFHATCAVTCRAPAFAFRSPHLTAPTRFCYTTRFAAYTCTVCVSRCVRSHCLAFRIVDSTHAVYSFVSLPFGRIPLHASGVRSSRTRFSVLPFCTAFYGVAFFCLFVACIPHTAARLRFLHVLQPLRFRALIFSFLVRSVPFILRAHLVARLLRSRVRGSGSRRHTRPPYLPHTRIRFCPPTVPHPIDSLDAHYFRCYNALVVATHLPLCALVAVGSVLGSTVLHFGSRLFARGSLLRHTFLRVRFNSLRHPRFERWTKHLNTLRASVPVLLHYHFWTFSSLRYLAQFLLRFALVYHYLRFTPTIIPSLRIPFVCSLGACRFIVCTAAVFTTLRCHYRITLRLITPLAFTCLFGDAVLLPLRCLFVWCVLRFFRRRIASRRTFIHFHFHFFRVFTFAFRHRHFLFFFR